MTRGIVRLRWLHWSGTRIASAKQQDTTNQSNEEPPVIRVDVDLVNILFTVRQKQGGQLVPNLKKEDFSIFEDGKEQTIAQFSRETDLP